MEFKELFENYAKRGSITFIGVRPGRLEPVMAVDQVLAVKDRGLEGDRYNTAGGARQITLIQAEHLLAMASFLGIDVVDPALLRRNVVVKGLNLLALKGKRFQIGKAVFEYAGECHPCSRMESALGLGGYNAMRGHGGITARVIQTGKIRLGDEIWAVGNLV